MALVQVKLLGELGRKFGRSYKFVADSPRQIISALSNQIEGFKEYMTYAHESGIYFRLVDEDASGMSYENVMMPCKRLIIAPVVTGGGGVERILVGVALIGLAFVSFGGAFAGYAAAAAAGKAAGFALGSGILFNLGVGLVLTGIASLLSPSVNLDNSNSESEVEDSFLFDRSTELTTQGRPIPVLYGRFLAASPLIISSALTTYEVPV